MAAVRFRANRPVHQPVREYAIQKSLLVGGCVSVASGPLAGRNKISGLGFGNGQNYSVNISELKETTIIKINKKIIAFLIIEFENFGESSQNCRVLSKN